MNTVTESAEIMNVKMTGFRRCTAAIDGNLPDRVPAYTPTIASDVAGKILGREAHTGGPGLWYAEAVAWSQGSSAWKEFDAQITEDIIDLHRALKLDVIRFPWRNNIKPARQLDDCTFVSLLDDGSEEIWRWDDVTLNFIRVSGSKTESVEQWPDRARRAERELERRIAHAEINAGAPEADLQQRLGDEMLVAATGGMLSLGLDEGELMAPLLEPAAVEDILDCDLAVALAELDAIAARGIGVVLGGGDMADKNGTIYSPELFRRFMLPRWKRIAERSRELSLHYVWRSDGNLWAVSDMLFEEAGMPGFGEADYDASMTIASIKARYPDLVVWSNVSGDLLRRGTADEVYAHCAKLLAASEGRRYFHGCSNTILPGTPPENVYAMMRAREDFRDLGF